MLSFERRAVISRGLSAPAPFPSHPAPRHTLLVHRYPNITVVPIIISYNLCVQSVLIITQLVEMLSSWITLCLIIITALHQYQSATLPFQPPVQVGSEDVFKRPPGELVRVREGAPPPLCAGRCATPTGPVCAFDAAGTARTFATLCELEAVSCHESTYYAITSLGEC